MPDLTREQLERIGYLTAEPEFAGYETPVLAAFAKRVLTDPVLAARMQPPPDHARSIVQAAHERAERAERMALIGRLYMAGVLRVHPDTMSPLPAVERMQPAEQQTGWRRWPETSPPLGPRVLSYREGEPWIGMSRFIGGADGTEWADMDGRTTVTHSTFLPPTHWMPLPAPPHKGDDHA